jgi:hypothetical protein
VPVAAGQIVAHDQQRAGTRTEAIGQLASLRRGEDRAVPPGHDFRQVVQGTDRPDDVGVDHQDRVEAGGQRCQPGVDACGVADVATWGDHAYVRPAIEQVSRIVDDDRRAGPGELRDDLRHDAGAVKDANGSRADPVRGRWGEWWHSHADLLPRRRLVAHPIRRFVLTMRGACSASLP